MTRRRRSGAPGLVIISWRDIPAQVTATGPEGEAKAMLPSRFQKAIDKAARVAGLTDHRSYIGEWRRATVPLTGDDPQSAVDELVARLDAEHDRETLAMLVRRGGLRQPDADRSTLADDPGGRP
jgi:hypothetical protein